MCSLLHVKLSKPTRDALIGSGVGLVHQVGLIMQIPASSSLAGVKAVILMIKEQWSDSMKRRRRGGEKGRVWGIVKRFFFSHIHMSMYEYLRSCLFLILPLFLLSGMCSAGGRIKSFISQQSTLPVSTATHCCIAAASGLYPSRPRNPDRP